MSYNNRVGYFDGLMYDQINYDAYIAQSTKPSLYLLNDSKINNPNKNFPNLGQGFSKNGTGNSVKSMKDPLYLNNIEIENMISFPKNALSKLPNINTIQLQNYMPQTNDTNIDFTLLSNPISNYREEEINRFYVPIDNEKHNTIMTFPNNIDTTRQYRDQATLENKRQRKELKYDPNYMGSYY